MFGLVPFMTRNNLACEDNVFDRLFDAFDEPFMQSFHTPVFKVDVKDNGDSYDLTAELPGLKKEDISLNYENQYLTISTQHAENKDEKDDKGNYIRRERGTSSMTRSFYIDDIDDAQTTAEYKVGVLTVHMPKKTQVEEKGHEINITDVA